MKCDNCTFNDNNIKQFPCSECINNLSAEIPGSDYFQERFLESNLKKIANDVVKIVEKKNNDYGNSFAESVSKYGSVAYLIRIQDKLNRLESLTLKGKEQAVNDESINDTLKDIIGYTLLMIDYNDDK